MTPTFGVSNFALSRHFDPTAGNSWTSLVPEHLCQLVAASWELREPGQGETTTDRKVVVPVDPSFIYGVYVKLKPEMKLTSVVKQRQEGEDYFVETRAVVSPPKANFAKVVLYSAEALLENGGERSTDADWEVVCLLASETDGVEPMHPLTMARNFLEKPGGIASVYSAEEFAESIYYWSQRVKAQL